MSVPFFFKKGKGEHGSSRITGDSPGREGNSLLEGLRKKGRGEGNTEPSWSDPKYPILSPSAAYLEVHDSTLECPYQEK